MTVSTGITTNLFQLSTNAFLVMLARATRSQVVQVIGTKFVLYRETHSKEKDKRIKLVK